MRDICNISTNIIYLLLFMNSYFLLLYMKCKSSNLIILFQVQANKQLQGMGIDPEGNYFIFHL